MVDFIVAETRIQAHTRPDLFSPKDLDKGSRALLESIASLSYKTALDWGCGWGALALWLAKHDSQAQVTALDSDLSAIKATLANKQLNGLKNLAVIASPGYDELATDAKFDLIVSNPPTHRGRLVVEDMIEQSKSHLKSDGKLIIVVEARLKPWVDRCLIAHFEQSELLRRTPKHVVLSA